VSDTDSFINEVTEEVRREKLFGYLRRYGWIGVACVLLLVGGAAFNEYRNAQARDAAQATGDALLGALSLNDPSATLDALAVNSYAPQMYRDLAAFKSAMLPTGDPAARKSGLEALVAPGLPFSLLAQEQLAYIALEEGDSDAAIAQLQRIAEDAGVTRGLRERAQTLIVALGAELPHTANQ
jgi:hypothetical protein